MPIFSSRYYKGPKSDHFDGRHFFNPWNRRTHSWLNVLRWKLTSKPKPWPQIQGQAFDVPPDHVQGSQIRLSFVGHATVLIQTCGLNILTDPIWAEWASPFKLSRTKRISQPGIRFDDLPKIDLVLVSHNHYDHLCLETLQKLWQRDRPRIIVPLGNDTIIRSKNPSIAVDSLDWDESLKIGESLAVHLLPSQHWSSRTPFDVDQALWGAFVIETHHGNIYFAGDTGYGQGEIFEKARAKFGAFRMALLPIGSYEPRWFMRYAHMNPQDAVQAYFDLGEPPALALHFETFAMTDEGFNDPAHALEEAKKAAGVPHDKFRALKVGQFWQLS